MGRTINRAGVVLVIAASLAFSGAAGAATTHASSANPFAFTGHVGSTTAPLVGKARRAPTDATGWTEGSPNTGNVVVVNISCLPFIFNLYNCSPIPAGANGTILWGDGQSSPATLNFDPICYGLTTSPFCDITVSGTNQYAEEGVYPVEAILNTGLGSAVGVNNLDVADAWLGTGSAAPVSGTEGTPVTVSGTFADGNGGAPLSDYVATIDWGDGTTSPGTVSGAGGSYTVTGTHTYEQNATGWPINISVSDIGGSMLSSPITTTATIADAKLQAIPGVLKTTEGTGSGVLATFTDANTGAPVSDFTATVNYGKGALPATVTGSGGSYKVTGPVPAEEGNYTPVVQIADIGTATTSTTSTVNVADAALTAGPGQTLSAFSTVPYSGVLGTFKDSDSAAPLSDYTASINWGDGTPSATGVVSASPTGGWQVTGGPHTYATPGTYTVTAAVTDVGGQVTHIVDTASVGSPPSPVTTITPSGPPNGNNGWYRTPIHLTAVANGLGLTVTQTRCVADPATAPLSFGALPASCPFAGPGGTLAGDGVHHIYAASANSISQENPGLTTIKIDSTPPSLACGKQPTFVLGSSGNSVPATVSDATSGPASSTVSGPAAVSSVGIHSVSLTGFDNAGNSATVSCSYRVLGHINNLLNYSVVPGSRSSTMFSMFALDVPIGSQIKVICAHAKGCPFHIKTLTASSHSKCKGKACKKHRKPNSVNVDLTSMFGKSHLPNGSQVLVEITKRFMIGKVWILTIRKNAAPASTITCMAPGSSKPGQGC